VGDCDAEALDVLVPLEGIQEAVHVVDQQRHVHAVKTHMLEGCVVDQRGAGVGHRVADDAKHLGRSRLALKGAAAAAAQAPPERMRGVLNGGSAEWAVAVAQSEEHPCLGPLGRGAAALAIALLSTGCGVH